MKRSTLTCTHSFITDVAMVIITTMVCKIYFPEALERGQAAPMARSYSYRIAEETDDYYGSDVSDDEDENNEEVLDSESSDDDEQARRKNFMEFDQGSMSRPQVLKRLLFCSLVLNITFVAWGVLQVGVSVACGILLLDCSSVHVLIFQSHSRNEC